ncbi:MAG: histone deacetylase [Candidatus Methanoliparum thermophilum]|uniref:Histone deacetylase n=1 Tax=Methanoliparum thermophilum TaxID=2491083 RepID=A0A520KTA5_METT2|nr:histone deacetylase [Candidatus Methanoliparum sp. LAM-1]RZN65212.1 MAG: histone deacetylase [Candidatus Methanoliparum thermophilum]BDC36604.1 histone deacetylase [Candidatus Methanoliparum sp. LAM-1]
MKTGIVYHDYYLKHEQGPTHPERRERLEYTIDQLREEGILEDPKIEIINPRRATLEEILSVHTTRYIERLKSMSEKGGIIDLDTSVPVGSYDSAIWSAGGALTAAEKVFNGSVKNSFALIRPPGHHAKPDNGAGFCYLNNMAIMIKNMIKRRTIKRAAILDWDAHHGDGTQAIFYDDPNVLYISIHQDGRTLYPGSGFIDEIGVGEGKGYNICIPVLPGASDDVYRLALDEIYIPLVEEFRPDFIAISAGQDNHFTDPLTNLALTSRGYAEMMKDAVILSDKLCKGRLVALLEGGYGVEGGLPYVNLGIIAAMADIDITNIREPKIYEEVLRRRRRDVLDSAKETVRGLKRILKDYWSCFR